MANNSTNTIRCTQNNKRTVTQNARDTKSKHKVFVNNTSEQVTIKPETYKTYKTLPSVISSLLKIYKSLEAELATVAHLAGQISKDTLPHMNYCQRHKVAVVWLFSGYLKRNSDHAGRKIVLL